MYLGVPVAQAWNEGVYQSEQQIVIQLSRARKGAWFLGTNYVMLKFSSSLLASLNNSPLKILNDHFNESGVISEWYLSINFFFSF